MSGNLNYSTMANAQKPGLNKTDASYQGNDLHVSHQPELTEQEVIKEKKAKEHDRIKRNKIRERNKLLREARGEAIDDDDIPEESDGGPPKTGYELTDYMEEYNKNTAFDYTEGYDPQKMDEIYR